MAAPGFFYDILSIMTKEGMSREGGFMPGLRPEGVKNVAAGFCALRNGGGP